MKSENDFKTIEKRVQNIINQVSDRYISNKLMDAVILIIWLKRINPKILLELGTGHGGSGKLIMSELPNIEFHTIDNGHGKHISEEAVGEFLPDGAHKYYNNIYEDLDKLLKKIKPDTIYIDLPNQSQGQIDWLFKSFHLYNVEWIVLHNSHKKHYRAYLENNKYYEELYYLPKLYNKPKSEKGRKTISIGLSVFRIKDEY